MSQNTSLHTQSTQSFWKTSKGASILDLFSTLKEFTSTLKTLEKASFTQEEKENTLTNTNPKNMKKFLSQILTEFLTDLNSLSKTYLSKISKHVEIESMNPKLKKIIFEGEKKLNKIYDEILFSQFTSLNQSNINSKLSLTIDFLQKIGEEETVKKPEIEEEIGTFRRKNSNFQVPRNKSFSVRKLTENVIFKEDIGSQTTQKKKRRRPLMEITETQSSKTEGENEKKFKMKKIKNGKKKFF